MLTIERIASGSCDLVSLVRNKHEEKIMLQIRKVEELMMTFSFVLALTGVGQVQAVGAHDLSVTASLCQNGEGTTWCAETQEIEPDTIPVDEFNFTGTMDAFDQYFSNGDDITVAGKRINDVTFEDSGDGTLINLFFTSAPVNSEINTVLNKHFSNTSFSQVKRITVDHGYLRAFYYDVDLVTSYRDGAVTVSPYYGNGVTVAYLFAAPGAAAVGLADQMTTYANTVSQIDGLAAVQARSSATPGRYNMAKDGDNYIMNTVTLDDATTCSVTLAQALTDYTAVTEAIADKSFILSLADTGCSDYNVSSLSVDPDLQTLAVNTVADLSIDQMTEVVTNVVNSNLNAYVGMGDYTVKLEKDTSGSTASVTKTYAQAGQVSLTKMATLTDALHTPVTAVSTTHDENGQFVSTTQYTLTKDGEGNVTVTINDDELDVADVLTNVGDVAAGESFTAKIVKKSGDTETASYGLTVDDQGGVKVVDNLVDDDDVGAAFKSFVAMSNELQSNATISDNDGNFTIKQMPTTCGSTGYCSTDFGGQTLLVVNNGTPAKAEDLIAKIKASSPQASFITIVNLSNTTGDAAGSHHWWRLVTPVQAATSFYGAEVTSGVTTAVLVTSVDNNADTYLTTHGTTKIKLVTDGGGGQVNLVKLTAETRQTVAKELANFQSKVSTNNATFEGIGFAASNDAQGKLHRVQFDASQGVDLNLVKSAMSKTTGTVIVNFQGMDHTFINGVLQETQPDGPDRPDQPDGPDHPDQPDGPDQPDQPKQPEKQESHDDSSAIGSNLASNASRENVPNEARDPGCAAAKPVGTPEIFQIDRQGTKATLYFTPVRDYTDRYHVVFGYEPGQEYFGGIAMHVSDEKNSGVLAIDIDNLDPTQQYSFKVAPVNGCAVGTWSEWLTAKGVARYGKSTMKTFRYGA